MKFTVARMVVIVLAVLICLISLASCATGQGDRPSGIGTEATGRGVVSNAEPLNNGLWQIWIFGDSTYVYCTLDAALVNQVKGTMREKDATIVYTYRDWKAGDPEFETTDASGVRISNTCGQFNKDTRGSKLLTVQLVNPAK